jgi:hypothetical protein
VNAPRVVVARVWQGMIYNPGIGPRRMVRTMWDCSCRSATLMELFGEYKELHVTEQQWFDGPVGAAPRP